MGANRHAQHRLRGRPDRQCACLHGRLSQSLDAYRHQLFHRQLGGGRSPCSAHLPAAVGSLGCHGDLVSRIKTL